MLTKAEWAKRGFFETSLSPGCTVLINKLADGKQIYAADADDTSAPPKEQGSVALTVYYPHDADAEDGDPHQYVTVFGTNNAERDKKTLDAVIAIFKPL
jgi:hypothetical protein